MSTYLVVLNFELLKPVEATPWLIKGTALDCVSKLLGISSEEMLRICSGSRIRLGVPLLSNKGVSFITSAACDSALPALNLDATHPPRALFPFVSGVWLFPVDPPLALDRFHFQVGLSRCTAAQIKEIPWTQTIFWIEGSLSWSHPHPNTHLMCKRVLWGLELDDL